MNEMSKMHGNLIPISIHRRPSQKSQICHAHWPGEATLPVSMKTPRLVDALESMCTKKITLRLYEVSRKPCAAISVIIGKGRAHGWYRDAQLNSSLDNKPPSPLAAADYFLKVDIKKQIGKMMISSVCAGNIVKQFCANDAACPPDSGYFCRIQIVIIFI